MLFIPTLSFFYRRFIMNVFSIEATKPAMIQIPGSFPTLSTGDLRLKVEALVSENLRYLKARHCSNDCFSEFARQVVKDYNMEVMYQVNTSTERGYYYLLFKTALESRVATALEEAHEDGLVSNSWFGAPI
jgi:hypothetical protein